MQVEIWSDIACPWCYIGKRRFEKALERFEHPEALNVTWRSFELNPEAPAESPGDMAERIAEKYGISPGQAREMEANVTATAAADGLDYHLDTRRGANTFDAHRLIHLAQAHGLGDAMKERLMAAHFSEGELVSDAQVLTRLAGQVGLDPVEVGAMLDSDAYAADVREDEQAARGLGISGVPTFVVDRQLGLSGAQPPEVLLQLLQQGWEQAAPVSVTRAGDARAVAGA